MSSARKSKSFKLNPNRIVYSGDDERKFAGKNIAVLGHINRDHRFCLIVEWENPNGQPLVFDPAFALVAIRGGKAIPLRVFMEAYTGEGLDVLSRAVKDGVLLGKIDAHHALAFEFYHFLGIYEDRDAMDMYSIFNVTRDDSGYVGSRVLLEIPKCGIYPVPGKPRVVVHDLDGQMDVIRQVLLGKNISGRYVFAKDLNVQQFINQVNWVREQFPDWIDNGAPKFPREMTEVDAARDDDETGQRWTGPWSVWAWALEMFAYAHFGEWVFSGDESKTGNDRLLTFISTQRSLNAELDTETVLSIIWAHRAGVAATRRFKSSGHGEGGKYRIHVRVWVDPESGRTYSDKPVGLGNISNLPIKGDEVAYNRHFGLNN